MDGFAEVYRLALINNMSTVTFNTPTFSVSDIRKSFLDFYASKNHAVVASSPLVPGNDPTLMFTNSGMVQFKDVFLGTDKRSYVRAASVQACLRAGGKHNDLENVGYTARHHTFFEMMGNWSFGDYFKRDSLIWGWELLTKIYKLPPERLLATVYIDDDEAYDIWHKEIGLPAERIVRIGDNKGGKYKSDNFWMMADTGPCGPCSEIFYDHGPHIPGGPPGSPDEDGDRFIEIWNHVFMQFDMQADGTLVKLPAPCVDTGMGLERLSAILQHVHSNYEIDIFDALIKAAARETDTMDLDNKSLRVIADHIRACSFLIVDGVNPSNEGRGYVQRRIVRRAIRHGYKLGKKSPFFHKLVKDLVQQMGAAYPNLAANEVRITSVLKQEEERFFETLEKGMLIIERALQQNGYGRETTAKTYGLVGGVANPIYQFPGDTAFQLHDTYGFPIDLTADVCREYGVSINYDLFNAHMERQRDQARAAGKFKMDKALEYSGAGNEFVGYERLDQAAKVVALYADGLVVQSLASGQNGVVVLDSTPFYAESGGQVGDVGTLTVRPELVEGVTGASTSSVRTEFVVSDTQKIKADVFAHHGTLASGSLKVGDAVQATVDRALRLATVRNHSATHLMHKALREVLGDHVQQKGSLVNSERTRFDFAHNAPVTATEITQIEALVNAEIFANAAASARVMEIEAAKATGAMMLFGEKYGDTVRVLEIGSSKELCGGTHVERTGDIGLFKIVGESGIASGVRRIEAVTGNNALAYLQSLEATVDAAAQALKTAPTDLASRIELMLTHLKALEKEVSSLKGKLASGQTGDLVAKAVAIGNTKLLVAELEGLDAKGLQGMIALLKDKLKSGIVVLAAVDAGKVQLAVGVTSDVTAKVKAGELVNFVAGQVGGKGGGKPDLAMAGGTEADKLTAALASVQGWVAAKL